MNHESPPPSRHGTVMSVHRLSLRHGMWRIASSLFCSYTFTWGLAALSMAGLVALGVDFDEAEMGVLLLAFVVFLGIFLWACAASHLTRRLVTLASAALLMNLVAWSLQRALLS